MTAAPANQSRRGRRAVARVQGALASELQPGESIETAALAQRWLPFLEVLLLFGALGDMIFVIVAKPYYIAASSSRFFLLDAGRFWPTPKKRVFEAPLDQVRIEQLRGGPLRRQIRLSQLGGPEFRLAVHRVYRRQLEQLESLVGH